MSDEPQAEPPCEVPSRKYGTDGAQRGTSALYLRHAYLAARLRAVSQSLRFFSHYSSFFSLALDRSVSADA